MDFRAKTVEDIVIVTPYCSELDASVSTKFKSKFADLIHTETKLFVLNLSHVNFIDSSGVGAIIRTVTLLKHHHASIVLCCVSKTALSLLKMIRLDQLMKIFPNEEEAISYLKTLNINKK